MEKLELKLALSEDNEELDAPDVSGLLRQSSVFSVHARRQSTTRGTSLVVKMVEPQRLLLRDTQST